MNISVNIPTYDEEENIRALIKNVDKIADEIIIIDNSKDKTPIIAKQLSKKVKIIHYEVKDFSKIRNEGIKNVNKNWYVLYLDADELLSDELIKNLKELKKQDKELADAYLIKRSHFFKLGKHTSHLTTRFIRGEPKLFKKGVIKFVNISHERPEFLIKNPTLIKIKGDTLHYPKIELNKYSKNSTYLKMHVKRTIKEGKIKKEILTQLKQLIKYILIFDYKPKYWIGNIKAWFGTAKYVIIFIKECIK